MVTKCGPQLSADLQGSIDVWPQCTLSLFFASHCQKEADHGGCINLNPGMGKPLHGPKNVGCTKVAPLPHAIALHKNGQTENQAFALKGYTKDTIV